jgi:hypothetical protein
MRKGDLERERLREKETLRKGDFEKMRLGEGVIRGGNCNRDHFHFFSQSPVLPVPKSYGSTAALHFTLYVSIKKELFWNT